MNAKRCKRLRTIARDETVGEPLKQLIHGTPNVKGPRCAVNDPDSFRGTYRQLKKLHARGIEQ